MTDETQNTRESVMPCTGRVLAALGQAWRMNWSDFDGRLLRSQLEDVAEVMKVEATGDDADAIHAEALFYVGHGICPTCRMWETDCHGHGSGAL